MKKCPLNNGLYLICLCLTTSFVLTNCAAPQSAQPVSGEQMKARTGVWIRPGVVQGPADSLHAVLRTLKAQGHTDIFTDMPPALSGNVPGRQGLELLFQHAKEMGIAVHAVLRTLPSPAAKPHVLNILETYDWDGLVLYDTTRAAMETMGAEALLLKPYLLLSSVQYPGKRSVVAGYSLDYSIVLSPEGDFPPVIPVGNKTVRPRQVIMLSVPQTGDWTLSFQGYSSTKPADEQQRLAYILPRLPDTLRLESRGAAYLIRTSGWQLPHRYALTEAGQIERPWPWIELRRYPGERFREKTFPFLAKAAPAAITSIAGDTVKQYQTGIFFKETPLHTGINRIRVEARYPDGNKATYYWEVNLDPSSPAPRVSPWIDSTSVTPESEVTGLQGDKLRVAFQGSKNGRATLELSPGRKTLPMERKDYASLSTYQTDLRFEYLKPGKAYRLNMVLQDSASGRTTSRQVPGIIQVKPAGEFPLVQVTQDKAPVSYNLGPIRLGGPLIAEYPKGVVLQTSGKTGAFYRVRLDDRDEGYIAENAVQPLPAGASRPLYYIQSVSAAPGESADILRIPYPEPVPYAIRPLPEEKLLRIRLYGVKTSSTWMSHRTGLRMIHYVHWEQVAPETYDLLVHLTTSDIWGYTLQPEGNSLVLRVKYPPRYIAEHENHPLKGMKIALEAGHGGSNTGAEGLSGLLEKDVNLDVSLRLEKLCLAAGMDVLQVRPSDVFMTLEQKRSMIERSDAHLHVSIHANSGAGGYLRTSGVSIYYNNPFWEKFARTMYASMLRLDLAEFGTVGSFNYHVTRIASRPSILVELAFLSHAEDEEKLASPEYRQQMAERIFAGIAEFVAQRNP